jgi:hypothetical protein
MAAQETELEMVRRHVREGEARVTRQREIVAGLPGDSDLRDMAESFLGDLENVLRQHKVHLARIEGKDL